MGIEILEDEKKKIFMSDNRLMTLEGYKGNKGCKDRRRVCKHVSTLLRQLRGPHYPRYID